MHGSSSLPEPLDLLELSLILLYVHHGPLMCRESNSRLYNLLFLPPYYNSIQNFSECRAAIGCLIYIYPLSLAVLYKRNGEASKESLRR